MAAARQRADDHRVQQGRISTSTATKRAAHDAAAVSDISASSSSESDDNDDEASTNASKSAPCKSAKPNTVRRDYLDGMLERVKRETAKFNGNTSGASYPFPELWLLPHDPAVAKVVNVKQFYFPKIFVWVSADLLAPPCVLRSIASCCIVIAFLVSIFLILLFFDNTTLFIVLPQ